MWIYFSNSGRLYDPTGKVVGNGYSGHGPGVNNQAMEAVHDFGPIPRGAYTIGQFFDDPEKGPIVAHLIPCPATDTFGRSGFMLHGDNAAGDHSASRGCIIMPRAVRAQVQFSPVKDLRVM